MRLIDTDRSIRLSCIALLGLGDAAEARPYTNTTANVSASDDATATQATTTTSNAPGTGLGGFILQGLGAISQSTAPFTTARLNATSSTYNDGSAVLASLSNAFPTTLFTEDCCTYLTKPTLTAARTGSGFSYASECNYEQQVHPLLALDPWSTSVYQTYTYTTKFQASITTLCDGVPRIVGTLTPTASLSSKINATSSFSYTGPWPTCNIGPSDCVQLRSTWSRVDSAWADLTSAFTTYLTLAPSATALTYGNNITGYQTTYFTGTDGSLPVITIGGTAYTANSSTYNIPVSLKGDITGSLSPGIRTQTFMPGESSLIFAEKQNWAGYWVSPTCTTTTQSSSTTTAYNSTITSGAALDGPCTIQGGNVKLMYFPVPQNVSREMCTVGPTTTGTTCPYGKTTATAECEGGCAPCPYYPFNITSTTDSGPYTTINGQTFYANRAYISLETAYAINAAGNRVGGEYAGTIITLPSSEIYSVQTTDDAGLIDNVATRFNFADLNPFVPAAAYRGAMWCIMYGRPSPAISKAFGGYQWLLTNETMGGMGKNSSFGSTFDWGYEFYAWVNDEPTDECNIILDEAYAPVLAVPPQMYSIDPLWTSCGLGLQGLYDPPTALTAVATEASVTIPTAMQTTTAEPSPAISSAAPQTSIAFTFATTSTQDPVLASSQTQIPKPGTSTAQHSTAQQQSSPTQDPDAGSGSAATDPASAVSTSILQTTIIIVPSNSLVDPSSGQGQASQPVGSGVSSQEPAVASTAGDPTTQTQPQAEVSSAPIQDPTDPAAATTIAFSDSQPSSQAATTANAAGPGEANTQAAQGGQGSTQDPHATAATSSTKLFFTYAGSTRSADQSGSAPDPDGTTIVLVSGANSGDPGVAPSAGSQEGVPATVTYEADGVQASATTVTYVAGSDTFTVVRATSASNVYGIGGTTVREGGAPAIVQGTTYSVGSTGVVVNGQRASAVSSQPFGSGSGASLTIVGVGGSSGAIAVHGATLYNGGSATVISGVTLSAGSGGLVIDHTRTVPVAIPSQQSQERGSAAVLTLGPQAYTAAAVSGSGKGVVLGGETLSPGGPAVSIKGHTVSEGSGVLIVDGTRTVALSASSTSRPEAIVTLGSETLTAEIAPGTGSAVVIGGHTIPSGSETTINGVDVSAGDSGLVIGGTKTIGFSPPAPATTASPKFVTIGGQTLTVQFPATIGGDAVINGITMTVGERTTLNGIVVNEGSAGVVFSALAASGSANRSSVTTSSSAGVLPSVLTTVTQDSPTRSAGRPSGSTSTKSGAWRVGTAVEEREGWMVGLVGVVVILLLF